MAEPKKLNTFALAFKAHRPASNDESIGEMVEWSITAVLKTAVPIGTGGSNPSLSAEISVTSCKTTSYVDFSFKGAPNLRQNFGSADFPGWWQWTIMNKVLPVYT